VWTPETLEFACADAMPPVTEDKIGDWRLRAAGGFTGRANSALAVGDPGVPIGQALLKVGEFALRHGIPPVVQAIEGSAVAGRIAAAGWVPHTGHATGSLVSVQTGPLGSPEPDGADSEADISVLAEPTPGWWELAVGNARPSAPQRHVLGTGDVGFAVAKVVTDVTTERTAGAVRAAVAGDVLHISRLAVRPGYRRRGLAKALMGACGRWAAGRGARACVLQVSVDNSPALALYRELGFREHHRYSYWVPRSSCEDRSL
jgi:ribosomal protein S18 acetylase RimI-like enzyme